MTQRWHKGVYEQFCIKTGSKTLAETCFCQSGRNPGRNLFLPGRFKPRFKPVLAETCQPCSQRHMTELGPIATYYFSEWMSDATIWHDWVVVSEWSQSSANTVVILCQGRVSKPFTLTNGTLNTTACRDCSTVYKQLNDVYLSMEMQYTNTVCADTIKMVITVLSWWHLFRYME